MTTAKISSKNQITIPRALLDVLKLKKGGRIVLEPNERGVLLRPVKGSVVDMYYGHAREFWKSLGGADKFIERERNSWDK